MAMSKCVACGGFSFEIKQAEPSQSAFKLYFVQCSMCGGVVGVQEYHNIGAMLRDQNKAIKAIAAKVGVYVKLEE